jgi:uncharacterized protein YndB with AHSA1/START domain
VTSSEGVRERPVNPVLQAGWKLSAFFVALLAALLIAGWLLPGSWQVHAERVIRAPSDTIFALLGTPRRWDEWTPWPEIPFTYEGPESGAGARRRWDAPDVGAGSFTITDAEPPTLLRYRVDLAGEDFPTVGSFRLEETAEGTRVTWSEEGDFGDNPVLGWAALAMRRRHGRELEARLEALAAAAEGAHAR